jgi:secreted PhoX family phosphatase
MGFFSHEAVDGDTVNRVMGMTPDGQVYAFASNRTSDGEFCGPTFAPDGKTFLVSTSRTPASLLPSGARSRDVFALPDMYRSRNSNDLLRNVV